MSKAEAVVKLPGPLVDLAAGRDPGPVALTPALIAMAQDHRVLGLLWSHLQRTGAGSMDLAMYDLRLQAHQQRVRDRVVWCHDVARSLGVDIAILKGAPIEQRYYDRVGERPSSDVDLLVAPGHFERIPALLRAIQPDHPWLPGLESMISGRQIQSITAVADGLEVDIHLDAFKLGVWLRRPDRFWAGTRTEDLWGGGEVRTPDDAWTLVLLLLHLTKDRFQRLLGYGDIVRVVSRGDVDWARVDAIARPEGLGLPVRCALHVVEQDLDVDLGLAGTPFERPPAGVRAMLWRWLWRDQIRLQGSEGRRRFRYRQDLLPILARGRQLETVRWWAGEAFPPRVAVAAEYPDLGGPYLWRLTRGRIRAAEQKRAREG